MKTEYFLGANTRDGFVSLFDELYRMETLYVIKGGPGTGKSTFMRRIAEAAEAAGHDVEYILCGSDPGSIDGFIDYTADTAMCDGTPPHTIEPCYPGAYEITVDMSVMWDKAALRAERERVVSLCLQTAECHRSCTAYLCAAGALLSDAAALTMRHVDMTEVKRFVRAVSAGWGDGARDVKKRFIAATSPGTTSLLHGTVEAQADTVIALDDDSGSVSSAVLQSVADAAREYESVRCFDPVMGTSRISHVILPRERTALVTRGLRNKREYDVRIFEPIPASRFLRRSYDVYAGEVRQLSVMASELCVMAAARVETAKRIHDELEAIYAAAMDFDAQDALAREFIQRLTE